MVLPVKRLKMEEVLFSSREIRRVEARTRPRNGWSLLYERQESDDATVEYVVAMIRRTGTSLSTVVAIDPDKFIRERNLIKSGAEVH
jgi:hypothetical protein